MSEHVSEDYRSWLEEGGMAGVYDIGGGEDRTSWKCDGGPHLGTVACASSTTDVLYQKRLRERVPYAGTESVTIIDVRRIRDPLSHGV